jgi:hypothetical protein
MTETEISRHFYQPSSGNPSLLYIKKLLEGESIFVHLQPSLKNNFTQQITSWEADISSASK